MHEVLKLTFLIMNNSGFKQTTCIIMYTYNKILIDLDVYIIITIAKIACKHFSYHLFYSYK